ncbi:hypothetical protein HGRIS_009693 [Hohenbuehelia grisea]|uniref:Uncharacterized protein n=1 Tax=Hohenbuehelia grisea TaxID=104357 RepID=A0ABR3J238_9AGAR
MKFLAVAIAALSAASLAQARWCSCFGYDKQTGVYGPHASEICLSGGVGGTKLPGPEGQYFCDVPMAKKGEAKVHEFAFKLTCGMNYNKAKTACYYEAPKN